MQQWHGVRTGKSTGVDDEDTAVYCSTMVPNTYVINQQCGRAFVWHAKRGASLCVAATVLRIENKRIGRPVQVYTIASRSSGW